MPTSQLIDGFTPEHLLKCAEDIIKKKTKASVVMDREAEARVPKFKEAGKCSCSTVLLARFSSFLFPPHFLLRPRIAYSILNRFPSNTLMIKQQNSKSDVCWDAVVFASSKKSPKLP
jgi:hypothetical protein